MKRRLSTVALVGALAVILLLSGCGEKSSGHAAPAAEKNVIKISDLADLPAAIAPGTVIELPAGLENISVAFGEDYNGDTNWEYARLDFVGDGYGLVIKDVSDLTIRGAGIDKTELVVELIDCDLNEDWEGYVYPNMEEDSFHPLEGLSVVRFDREVLRGTVWNAYYLISEDSGEWLDSTVQLIFDTRGDHCTLDGYYDRSVSLKLEYDSTGYVAFGYEDADADHGGEIYLHADNTVDESDVILELEYGDYYFYFKFA